MTRLAEGGLPLCGEKALISACGIQQPAPLETASAVTVMLAPEVALWLQDDVIFLPDERPSRRDGASARA